MADDWENEIETHVTGLSLSSDNPTNFRAPGSNPMASDAMLLPGIGRSRGYVCPQTDNGFSYLGRGKLLSSTCGGFKSSFGDENSSKSTNFEDADGWNENEDSAKPSGGFGSSRVGGFGRNDNENKSRGGFGSSNKGGFGSNSNRENGSRGGFGSSGGGGGFGSNLRGKSSDGGGGDDDGWNENEDSSKPASTGFGSRFGKSDDGGSRGGFGSNSRGGGTGGFGRGGGGAGGKSKGCFKCGEEGHMSRECPNSNSSSSNNKGCFKCGEEGHMSRECPKGDSGNRSKGCFKCGEEGHMSRDCPNNDSSSSSNNRACFKCGEEGHMSRDCPNGNSSSGNRSKGCFKCGEDGHMSRDCPNSNSSGKSDKGCFKCGESGHISKDCTSTKPMTTPDGKPREIYIPPEVTDDNLFEGISTGANFDNYDNIPVRVTGNGSYKPISTFQDAGIRDLLKQNIQKANYLRPTPIQKYSIPIILENRDLMACAQTGSGKTAAFLVPIINGMLHGDLPSASFKDVQEPLTVILSPTRELAIQIFTEARKFSYGTILRCCIAYGGTSVNYQLSQLKQGCHLLVATPGRLLDFVRNSKISFSQLKYLVLDEADRMLDMGFLPAIREVVDHSTTPPKEERLTLMFSATFPTEIQTLAAEFLNNYMFISVGNIGSANTDVEQSFYQVEKFSKRDKLLEILQENVSEGEKVLVFVETKRNADFVAAFMSQKHFPTTSIHGDRLQREREEALSDFRRGKMVVLVATAVAARGLDIKNVNLVVNYDLPQTIEEYVHRIGRTGRVGNTGRAISFYDSTADQPLARALVQNLQAAQQPVPDWLESESMGMSSYSTQSSGNRKFGARDIRGFKDKDESSPAFVDGAGFGNVGGIDDEESWE